MKVVPPYIIVEKINISVFITEEVMKELAQVSYITFIHKDSVRDLEL